MTGRLVGYILRTRFSKKRSKCCTQARSSIPPVSAQPTDGITTDWITRMAATKAMRGPACISSSRLRSWLFACTKAAGLLALGRAETYEPSIRTWDSMFGSMCRGSIALAPAAAKVGMRAGLGWFRFHQRLVRVSVLLDLMASPRIMQP